MIITGIGLLIPNVVTNGISVLTQAAVSFVFTLVVTYLFFRLNLFGAADAKCLIAMSVLLPTSPSFVILSLHFPLSDIEASAITPFALTTLMNAALLAAIVPLSLCLRNLVDLGFKGFFRHIKLVFIGYQTSITQLARKKHIRLVHPLPGTNEHHRGSTLTGVELDDEMLQRLHSEHRAGRLADKVWVTPELPFMVFITSGFLAAVVVGNLLLALAIR